MIITERDYDRWVVVALGKGMAMAHVDVKVRSASVLSWTKRTFVGCFDWSVDYHHVILEMMTLRKVFVAHGTRERPLVRVLQHVPLELVLTTRAIRAMVASQGQLGRRDVSCGIGDRLTSRQKIQTSRYSLS